jgi:hypothetical protein
VEKEASVAEIAPMLGAILGISKTPKGQDKKRAKKSRGEKSVTEPMQQHGELASNKEPAAPISDKKMMKESAKYTLRRATDDWVEGRISTKEHKAVHERTKHVLSGKPPHEFRGMSGERSFKKMR